MTRSRHRFSWGLLALLGVLLAGCSNATPEPVVTEVVAESPAPSPSPSASPSPSVRTVNGCQLKTNTDCQGVDLHSQDLQDIDVQNGNFSNADLAGAQLQK